MLIGAEATDIVDANGVVLASLRYASDGDAAVALATEILGPPTGTDFAVGLPHYAPADGTMWGGFQIWVNRYEPYEGQEIKQPTGDELLYETPFAVLASAPETSTGIPITAVDGTAVGDLYSDVIAGKDATVVHYDETFGYGTVALDLPTSFPAFTDAGEGVPPMAHGVIAGAEAVTGPITSIRSPFELYSLV